MPAKLIAQLAATLIVGAVVRLDYLDGGLDPAAEQHPILAASLLVWCELFIAFGIRAALEQRQQVEQLEIRTRRPETPCRCFCCRAVNVVVVRQTPASRICGGRGNGLEVCAISELFSETVRFAGACRVC